MARIQDIPIAQIRRPFPRQNNQVKVRALMRSIREVGLQEPIDILEVNGKYYGFSGCHRYEACTKLGSRNHSLSHSQGYPCRLGDAYGLV